MGLLIAMLPPQWPVVIAVDETLERRQGARIRAKGMYRDAVRSRRSQVVTCLGVQWICMALLVPVPWSERPWALSFMTRLVRSARADVPQRSSDPDHPPASRCPSVRLSRTARARTTR
ncbi:hypothetical protein, partial [Imhoffiella purpurea]